MIIKRAFTLIELLIVIGILSVLVVTILITLNPAEAQKKARDTKRMKDLATLQSIVEQYINDGNPPLCTGLNGCNSTQNSAKTACGDNWLAADLCKYTKTVPIDPSNGVERTFVWGGTVASPTFSRNTAYYKLKMEGSDYEIDAFQESRSNANNVLNDGGSDTSWAEVGSNLNLLP